jgi:hypothetical protein
VTTSWVVITHADMKSLSQHLAQQRQHRRVREMKHHGAHKEEDQRAIPEEHPDTFYFAAFLAVRCAASKLVVNLGGPDHQQDENRRNSESCDEEEDAAVGNKVAKQAHRHGGNHVSCRVEGLIAPLAGVECGTSYDPQRHRAYRRQKDARRAANQDLGAHDAPERGKQRDQERASSQRSNAHTHQRTFRSQKVNQTTSRGLRENARDAADGERETHALFVPFVAGQINREERPHSRLHVGEEEIEPVETAQRLLRRGWFGLDRFIGLGRSLHGQSRTILWICGPIQAVTIAHPMDASGPKSIAQHL